MNRSQVARLTSAAGAGYTLTAVAFTAAAIRAGNFSVTVAVTFTHATSPPKIYDVCDDAGKIKLFVAMDDFMKSAVGSGVLVGASVVTYSVNNVVSLEPVAFSGDYVKRATGQLINISKQIDAATIKSANLAAQVALFGAVLTASETLVKAEKVAQKLAVDENKAYLQSEVARINAIITI